MVGQGEFWPELGKEPSIQKKKKSTRPYSGHFLHGLSWAWSPGMADFLLVLALFLLGAPLFLFLVAHPFLGSHPSSKAAYPHPTCPRTHTPNPWTGLEWRGTTGSFWLHPRSAAFANPAGQAGGSHMVYNLPGADFGYL